MKRFERSDAEYTAEVAGDEKIPLGIDVHGVAEALATRPDVANSMEGRPLTVEEIEAAMTLIVAGSTEEVVLPKPEDGLEKVITNRGHGVVRIVPADPTETT